ncbi:efflux RND transporter periplasmic adaptor subunit [Cupriavidus sp. KK10]|uniref:efflux RND transporter periplasmic adaptor subunit n=1 Tax=Cupriavidus sp. KK10 TaxID=1478019 RepID=UPI001BABFD92|nr:efflux RND transporter periplasmic adaptor subunit [Cupriavidus sp. KK10]QUN30503.1 efflux RND transporter periplasmic adaptor subunit [Cupriavidus sp. KK10]
MPSHNTLRRSACLAAVTLAVLALAGCGPAKPASPKSATPEVTVVTARRTSVPVSVELPGRTSAYLIAQVRARVDGIVQKRSFQEGADVKANQPLYQIDPAQYRAALDSASAALQKAEANLATTTAQAERYQTLVAGNAISKQAYDNAVAARKQAAADVAAAKAAVEMARLNLGYTDVVAPIAGRSGISQVTQGAYVQGSAATLLTTIQQIDPIHVDLNQASVAGLQLRRDVASGQVKLHGLDQARVTLTLEDGTQYPLAGKLEFSGITVDPATGSVTVRAVFPNPDHVLLPGMFVRARLEQGVNDNAFLVPVPAVGHNPQGQATALVVGPDNKVVQRTIQAQSTSGDKWIVTGGLSDGDRVIVTGGQKVQPGMLVQAVDAQARTAQAAAKANAGGASATRQAPVLAQAR